MQIWYIRTLYFIVFFNICFNFFFFIFKEMYLIGMVVYAYNPRVSLSRSAGLYRQIKASLIAK